MERNPDLELIQAPSYDADDITRQARAIADQAFKRYDIDGNGTIDKEELFDMCLTVGQVAFISAFSLNTSPSPSPLGAFMSPFIMRHATDQRALLSCASLCVP